MKICVNKRSWSLFDGSHSITISDISKATGPIFTNFYIERPWAEGRKVCSNSPGHMTNMAIMPIHGKNLYKSPLLIQWIDCLEI